MRYVFAVLVLAILSGVLLAQSINRNEALPECTPQQAKLMVAILDAAGVTPQIEQVREDEERRLDSTNLFDGYLKALRDYDEDFKSRLPACSLALRYESALYRLLAANGYWYGANMLYEEDEDSHDFLRLEEEVPGILESAVEEFDTIFAELTTLAEEAE